MGFAEVGEGQPAVGWSRWRLELLGPAVAGFDVLQVLLPHLGQERPGLRVQVCGEERLDPPDDPGLAPGQQAHPLPFGPQAQHLSREGPDALRGPPAAAENRLPQAPARPPLVLGELLQLPVAEAGSVRGGQPHGRLDAGPLALEELVQAVDDLLRHG
jgi:hypothetical protein